MKIKTDRLILRPFEEEDLPRLTQISTNPIVMRQFPPTFKTASAAKKLHELIISHQKRKGYSLWAVMDKASKKLIGFCGFITQKVEGEDLVEMGYRFDCAYWNKGLATEAAKACLDYAKDNTKLTDVYSMVLNDNPASRRVAEKVGLTTDREVNFHGRMHDLFHLKVK